MAEPLACCIHGIDLAQIHTGDTVLVIGGGAIGLLMVQLAKMAGAAKVILSEPVKFRRDLGEKLGRITVLILRNLILQNKSGISLAKMVQMW